MCNVCSRRSNTINSTSTCVIEASQLYAFYFLVPVCDNCRLSALTRHFKQSIRCGPQLITITRTPPSSLIQRWAEFFGRIHILAQNRISPNNSAHLWFNSALGRGQLLALTPWRDEDTMRTISIPDCDLHCSLHSAACLLWQDNFICMWAAGQSCSNQDSNQTILSI